MATCHNEYCTSTATRYAAARREALAAIAGGDK